MPPTSVAGGVASGSADPLSQGQNSPQRSYYVWKEPPGGIGEWSLKDTKNLY